MMLHHVVLLLLRHRLYLANFIYVLVVDELALLTISAEPWRLLMPLLAHFGLIVLVEALWRWLEVQLVVAVSVGAILVELARPAFHKVSAQLSLVIELEVLNIP